MNEYYESQARASGAVTTDDLLCKTCVFKDDKMPTAYCKVFQKGDRMKPDKVLLGGDCYAYKKESE